MPLLKCNAAALNKINSNLFTQLGNLIVVLMWVLKVFVRIIKTRIRYRIRSDWFWLNIFGFFNWGGFDLMFVVSTIELVLFIVLRNVLLLFLGKTIKTI